MKLERNRAERRSKRGIPILYNGIPYLIFAALAAGFLLGAPQLAATSSIAQSAKSTTTILERRQFPFAFAGYLGKTNSVLSRGFTESDFTFTGSKTWLDDGDGNWRLKFTSSGTFTPQKNITIDIFLVGGGGGGRNSTTQYAGGGGGGGYTGTWASITLNANVAYTVTIGAGGAGNGGTGGTTSISGTGINTMSRTGGTPGATYYYGGNGGSGGGADGPDGYGGSDGSVGGGDYRGNYRGSGQGTTTREFGETSGALYAGGGSGGGEWSVSGSAGAGGGGKGGDAGYNGAAGTTNLGGGGGGGGCNGSAVRAGAAGGSGIAVIRNAR